MSDHAEIRVTCGSADEARAIARRLVDDRLAACVHALPIASVYEWGGEVHEDDEVLLLATSRADRFAAVAAVVTTMHSYELPAITMVALTGSAEYLAWVDTQVRRLDG